MNIPELEAFIASHHRLLKTASASTGAAGQSLQLVKDQLELVCTEIQDHFNIAFPIPESADENDITFPVLTSHQSEHHRAGRALEKYVTQLKEIRDAYEKLAARLN